MGAILPAAGAEARVPAAVTTSSSAPAPSPSVTTRMLNGGISSSAMRIAGQVSPQRS